MALVSYRETRPWAKAISRAVLTKKMPPWFADPAYGAFSNDPSLSKEEIETVTGWVNSGAAEGSPQDAPPPISSTSTWTIGKPDAVFAMPRPFIVPKSGEIDYQWVIVPAHFTEDRWIDRVEVLPGNRAVVHHAVVYIREPGSTWLKDRQPGDIFTLSSDDPGSFTTSDILFTYTPGAAMDQWPQGMAKLVKAGSDLVFQMHYTAVASGGTDQSRIGLIFSPPKLLKARADGCSSANDRILSPPGAPDVRVGAWGTLPNDALLLSLYPHMHLRGKAFEYFGWWMRKANRQRCSRSTITIFHWQAFTYRLRDPLRLRPLERELNAWGRSTIPRLTLATPTLVKRSDSVFRARRK